MDAHEHTRCWRDRKGQQFYGAVAAARICLCGILKRLPTKFRILERSVDNVQSIKIHSQIHTRSHTDTETLRHARCSGRTLRIRNASKILICCWRSWFWHITLAFNSIRTHRRARRACVTHKARHTQNTRHRNLCFGFSFPFFSPVTRKGFCAWASARSASLFELLTFNATQRPQLDSLTGPGRPRKQQQRQQQQRERRQSVKAFAALSQVSLCLFHSAPFAELYTHAASLSTLCCCSLLLLLLLLL